MIMIFLGGNPGWWALNRAYDWWALNRASHYCPVVSVMDVNVHFLILR